MQVAALIMAGGKGERFWPASNRTCPKQMLSLAGDKPLVAQSVERLTDLMVPERILIVTNRDLAPSIASAVPEVDTQQVIGEPQGRNTAPCIGIAATWMSHRWGGDCVMAVQTADHHIGNRAAFQEMMKTGIEAAEKGHLVTVGILPDRPETGYGYLELGKPLDPGKGLYRVKRFVEKPNLQKAQEYFQSGNYLWNGGMFFWKCSSILGELQKQQPEMMEPLRIYADSLGTEREKEALEKAYRMFPNISIDYAVMEKAERVLTVKAEIDWDDLGNWAVLERLQKPDEQGNIAIGEHCAVDTKGCILSTDKGLLATYGIRDLVVVRCGDAVLVVPKDRASDLKDLISEIRKNPELERYL